MIAAGASPDGSAHDGSAVGGSAHDGSAVGGSAHDGSARRGVLCAGSMIADVGKVIDAYPQVERLAFVEDVALSTGGPGLNLAVDLCRLGAPFPVTMLGAVGDDAHGAFVLAECARVGVGTAGVRVVPGVATSFTDVMVERNGGRRTFFHHFGAAAEFDLDEADLATTTARVLHCGAPGIIPRLDAPRPSGGNGWSHVLAAARAAGLWTNLEMVTLPAGRERELVLPCLPHVDSIVVNELEAGALTGDEVHVASPDGPVDWAALEAVAQGLLGLGVHGLAVVHFPAGCVAATPDGRTYRQGSVRLRPGDVVSTTGAGDAFAAGVVLGLHEGYPVEASLRLGAAGAAACVRDARTSDGVLAADRCLELADAVGYRPTR